MRIVSLIPSATEILAALGLQDSLVGVTHSCDYPVGLRVPRVTSTTIPKDAPSEEIDRIVKVHASTGRPLYMVDTELLERLRPDLIVTQGVCDVCAVGADQAAAAICRLSTSPAMLTLHPHRFSDVLSDILRVGEAADVASRAASVVTELRERTERVRRRVAAFAPVDVVVLEWIDPPFSSGHWTPDIVAMAGGRELLSSPGARSRELAWDEVRDTDPDVLVLACCGHDERRAAHDLSVLASRPGFAEMTAVRENRVHVADGGSHFSRPGPRVVESLELLAQTLHPDAHAHATGLARVRVDRATTTVPADV